MAKISVDRALTRAKYYAKMNEFEEAQKLYQTVLQAFPMNKRAQEGLAALNKPKQSATRQEPSQDMLAQLLNLYNQGQFAAVVVQTQALAEQYPESFFVWNILGAARKGLGKTFEASEAFKKVTELNPNYADGHSNLGVILKEQGKLNEAIESFNKALSLKPDYAEAYNNMGNTLKDQGKLDEAITSYNKALSLKPDYAEAQHMVSSLTGQTHLNYTRDDLYTIFRHNWKPQERLLLSILITTGMRLSEAANLSWERFSEDHDGIQGMRCFSLLNTSDEIVAVKNKGSMRIIPLHPDLVLPPKGTGRLFDYKMNEDGLSSHDAGKAINTTLQKLVPHPQKMAHSFRGTLKELLRDAGVSKEISDFYTGHSSGDVAGTRYGGVGVDTRYNEISKEGHPWLKYKSK